MLFRSPDQSRPLHDPLKEEAMVANVCVTGRHLIDDAHKKKGLDKKCRQNADRLSVQKNQFNRVKRVKEGAPSEYRQQLFRTFAPSEKRTALSQVACCRHVLVVRGFADTVLLNKIN